MAGYGKRIAATAAVLGAIGLGVTAASPNVSAQSPHPGSCAPQKTLAETLGRQFGEAVTGEGVDASGNLIQVFTSETGTWTIAVTVPGGASCIVSVGEGWADTHLAQMPKPAPQPGHAS